jgi:hypothetical protein
MPISALNLWSMAAPHDLHRMSTSDQKSHVVSSGSKDIILALTYDTSCHNKGRGLFVLISSLFMNPVKSTFVLSQILRRWHRVPLMSVWTASESLGQFSSPE